MRSPSTPLDDALGSLKRGDLAAAAERCGELLRQQPDHFGGHFLLGMIEGAAGRVDEAATWFERAAALNPGSFEAWRNLGTAQARLGRHEAARASLAQAAALRPDDGDTRHDLGAAQLAAGELEAALASLERAVALKPGDADVPCNLGQALRRLGRLDAAIAQFERALALQPDHAAALNGLGAAFAESGRHDAAVAPFEKALALAPDFAESHNNLGNALRNLRRHDAAVASYERAIALKPDYAEALSNLGNALKGLKRYDEALASYEKALALAPRSGNALSQYALVRRQICDWRGIERSDAQLREAVRAQHAAIQPFALLAVSDDPAEQLACARQYWASRRIAAPAVGLRPVAAADKLRLGYLSADFHEHATARLMAELFERHDRAQFETIAFSYGPADGSALRRRLVAAFDRFVDVAGAGDGDIARRIRAEEVDILIDLKGHTEDNRLGVLAWRPAPVQAHYLGYPGTLGTDAVDYLIVDRFVAPPQEQRHFSESLVYLPDCYQVNDRQRALDARIPSRRDCGLPEHGFVFCCFNGTYKIAPEMFAVWMRLLGALPGSVLWLLADNPWAEANLRREAGARGIDPGRLVFAPRQKPPQHLARQRLADLFLDTLPVNAHTTASDALWAGLPLVTCSGRSFVARVAGSLLHAVGLDELVTRSLADYERLALALACDPARLAAIRGKLEAARLAAPLFDSERTCRALEAAYREMWEIRRRGEAPRSFAVSATG